MPFVPEDFNDIIGKEQLEKIMTDVVHKIRSPQGKQTYQTLIKKIKDLQNYQLDIDSSNFNNDDKKELAFQTYKKIINISLEMKKILKSFSSIYPQLEHIPIYDTIDYVIYIEGERHEVTSADIKQVLGLKSTGLKNGKEKFDLVIDLKQLKENLDKQEKSVFEQRVSALISDHYQSYINILEGEYKGQKEKFNYGHVAEAFESHLSKDHPVFYHYLMEKDYEEISKMDSNSLWRQNDRWEPHESSTDAWRHIRGAKGQVRGTVAGDVWNKQVKQLKRISTDDKRNTVRLSSLQNLQNGMETYWGIFNSKITDEEMAKQLANYLTGPVSKAGAQEAARLANKNLDEIVKSRVWQ